MEQEWEVKARHIYREANVCTGALANWGIHQQHLLSVYNTCPNFVYQCFVWDLAGLENNRLCARWPDTVGVV